jgi:hypothetical protein
MDLTSLMIFGFEAASKDLSVRLNSVFAGAAAGASSSSAGGGGAAAADGAAKEARGVSGMLRRVWVRVLVFREEFGGWRSG